MKIVSLVETVVALVDPVGNVLLGTMPTVDNADVVQETINNKRQQM